MLNFVMLLLEDFNFLLLYLSNLFTAKGAGERHEYIAKWFATLNLLDVSLQTPRKC